MVDVVNLWPDPDLQTTNRSAYVAGNVFPNPTPTVDLSHWAAVSGGSITRTADAKLFPETSYGCRVVNGVKLTGATTTYGGSDSTFTGRVRASEAMTITISQTMLNPAQTPQVRTVGWGDFGWGETLNYVDGAAKTFTAGEVATFRIYCGEYAPGASSGVDHNIVVTLSGTGTFDVDGIVEWIGVDDGAGDTLDAIPNAPLFFCGDTPDDASFTYSWLGTPYNSPSLQTANVPKYVWSTYDYEYSDTLPTLIPEAGFAVTKGGEKRVAFRSAIMFGRNDLIFTDGTIPEDPDLSAGFTVPPGNYVFSFDYVADYPVYFYGYPEPEWACNPYFFIYDADPALSFPANRISYMPINGYPPYRRRMVMPFTATATSVIQPSLDTGQNWVTGDIYITNVAVFEIPEILSMYDGLPTGTGGIWDLMALGVEAGKSYHANMELSAPNGHPVFEYKIGAGSWTTLVESELAPTEEPIQILGEYFDFTVPAGATEVRLRMTDTTVSVGTFDLFPSPPEFFSGDTPDGGGYTYSWSGTPYDSTSIRSEAPAGPTAQIFAGGTAKAVAEMRVSVGGSLITVTEAGA
jgi:hypothetical protein